MRKMLSLRAWNAVPFLLLLLAVTGCLRTEMDGPVREVVFSVAGDGFPDSRSVLTPSVENRVTSVLLLFYKGGLLEKVASFSGSPGLAVTFPDDEPRNVHALVNMASVREEDIPLQESGLDRLSWRLTSYADLERDGLPMAESAGFRPSDGTCLIRVRRLLSRFAFSLTEEYRSFFDVAERVSAHYPDPSYLFKDMTYSLKNINGTLRPFGVSAAGPEDVLEDREFELTTDGTAVLYVPENMQGDLLASPDPADKTMDALRDKYGEDIPCATFVEVTLRQDPSIFGVGGGLTYRFFLGNDNSGNFSVERNLHYNVLFGPEYDTVMGCFDTDSWTWKVESDDWRDSRFLYMDGKAYSVLRGGSLVIPVNYGYDGKSHPENGDSGDLASVDCDWRAYVKPAGQSDAALVHYSAYGGFGLAMYNRKDGKLTFQMSNAVPAGTRLELVLRTRDGRHEDRALLTVLPDGDVSAVWNYLPEYVAQRPVLSLNRTGTALSIASVRATEGGDRVSWSVADGKCTLSLLKAGPVSLEVTASDGSVADVTFAVKAPLLKADRTSLSLRLDGSSAQALTLSYTARAEDGSFAFTVAANDDAAGSRSFAPSLYAALLAPSLSVGSGALAPWLAVSGMTGYLASYDPAGMSSYFGVSYPGSFVAQARACEDVVPLPVSATLQDPFPGFSADGDLGDIYNYSVIGFYSRSVPSAAPYVVFTGQKTVEYTGGPTLRPTVDKGSLSFRSTEDFSYGLSAADKLELTPVSNPGHAVGKLPLVAQVRNVRSGGTTEVALGWLDCYLFTQLGGVLKGDTSTHYARFSVSADLCGSGEVAAFADLRKTVVSQAVVLPDFNTGGFHLRMLVGGRNVWTMISEESLEGTYQIRFDDYDSYMMSTWTEKKVPDSGYKLGETVYDMEINTDMMTIRDYDHDAVMVYRTTSPRLKCDLSSVSGLRESELGYHYAYDAERDAAGRPYHVFSPLVPYFMEMDVRP